MLALLAALIPVITGGTSLGAAIGSLTLLDWIGVAAGLVSAEPKVVAAIKALHPVFEDMANGISRGEHPADVGKAGYNSFQELVAANGKTAIKVQDNLGG
jgi:hypothetical protein